MKIKIPFKIFVADKIVFYVGCGFIDYDVTDKD